MKHFSTSKSLGVIRARRKVGLFLFLQENELTDHSGIFPLWWTKQPWWVWPESTALGLRVSRSLSVDSFERQSKFCLIKCWLNGLPFHHLFEHFY